MNDKDFDAAEKRVIARLIAERLPPLILELEALTNADPYDLGPAWPYEDFGAAKAALRRASLTIEKLTK